MVQCPICLDTLIEPITLPCGHNICKDCEIDVPIVQNQYNQNRHGEYKLCSLCRQPYSETPKINKVLHDIIKDNLGIEYTNKMNRKNIKRRINTDMQKYVADKRFKSVNKLVLNTIKSNSGISFDNLSSILSTYSNSELLIHIRLLRQNGRIIIVDNDIIDAENITKYLKNELKTKRLTPEKALYIIVQFASASENHAADIDSSLGKTTFYQVV